MIVKLMRAKMLFQLAFTLQETLLLLFFLIKGETMQEKVAVISLAVILIFRISLNASQMKHHCLSKKGKNKRNMKNEDPDEKDKKKSKKGKIIHRI